MQWRLVVSATSAQRHPFNYHYLLCCAALVLISVCASSSIELSITKDASSWVLLRALSVVVGPVVGVLCCPVHALMPARPISIKAGFFGAGVAQLLGTTYSIWLWHNCLPPPTRYPTLGATPCSILQKASAGVVGFSWRLTTLLRRAVRRVCG